MNKIISTLCTILLIGCMLILALIIIYSLYQLFNDPNDNFIDFWENQLK